MWPNPQFPAGSVTLIEEILNGKFHFLCSVSNKEFLDIQAITECRFTLKLVCDMIKKHNLKAL